MLAFTLPLWFGSWLIIIADINILCRTSCPFLLFRQQHSKDRSVTQVHDISQFLAPLNVQSPSIFTEDLQISSSYSSLLGYLGQQYHTRRRSSAQVWVGRSKKRQRQSQVTTRITKCERSIAEPFSLIQQQSISQKSHSHSANKAKPAPSVFNNSNPQQAPRFIFLNASSLTHKGSLCSYSSLLLTTTACPNCWSKVLFPFFVIFCGVSCVKPRFQYVLLYYIYLMSKVASKAFDPAKYVRKNLNADTVGKLKEVFDVFDYDGSGNVSTEELINTIRALNLESQAAQILAIVNNSGHVGEIDFNAFLDIFGFGGDSTSESTLQSIFEDFDISKTGAFGPEEFEKVAASVGEHFSSAEVDQIIQYADKDRDGVISFEEFVHVVTAVYPKV